MTTRVYFTCADGRVCCWEAAAPCALPALRMLRRCTGLPAESAAPPDYYCRIGEADRTAPERYFVKRIGMGFLPPQADGSREVHLARWDGPGPSRHNGFRVRLLYFQGVAPLLERHASYWVHGALLERDGRGFMVCGPSGIGKSTTAARLARAYRVLADDCALLTRRDDGRWYAQPVPTWSIWVSGKPQQCDFDCNRAVPLDAVFLLERGADRVIAVTPELATLGLVPSFTELVAVQMNRHPDAMRHALLNRGFEGAYRLVREVPVRRLSLTLESDACRVIAQPPAGP